MNTRSFIPVPLFSTAVTSTSTVGNATVDLGPYFNVMRRECIFVYSYTNHSTALVADQLITGKLQGSDSTAAANSTSTTAFTDISGSTFTSTGSTSVVGSGLLYAYVQPTQRYIRFVCCGAGTLPIIGVTAGLIVTERAA